jgi:ABC-2 type transport system permease protein
MARSKRSHAILQFGLFFGILLFVNILANTFYTHLDLTEEQRFTLSKPTKNLLNGLGDRVYIQVLFGGDMPVNYKRLQTATREILDDFRAQSGWIDYQFENPLDGADQIVRDRQEALKQEGLLPSMLPSVGDAGERSQQLVYPFAIVHHGSKKVYVNLYENDNPVVLANDEGLINNCVSKLEYKFADAIKKIMLNRRGVILFTAGQGELKPLQTKDLERSLNRFYDTGRLILDSVIQIDPKQCDLLIVAKPLVEFSEKNKFKIDQYIMQGGRVIWMLDRMNADLDSLQRAPRFVSIPAPFNLDDLLFKYGARINTDAVADLECTQIPLNTGPLGNAPQFKLFPWYFYPAVQPAGNHPVVKNMDRVELRFCSSIDTIRTKTAVKKTPLLVSSQYSRLQLTPVEMDLNTPRYQPDPSKFNNGKKTVGLLLEGTFPSAYETRVSAEMLAGLQQSGIEFRNQSQPTRMAVISDGDIAANFVRDYDKKEWLPLGYNRFEKTTYANKEFMLNLIEYLIDPNGVIEARNKEVRLRLLDTVRAKNEKPFWRGLNIGLPLVFLGIFGFVFMRFRKKKYAL